MAQNIHRSSLWLAGLTLAAAVPALVAAGVVPIPVPTQIEANEASAIDSLQRIAAAQNTLKAAVDIDTDGDGVGEYGFFAELGGTQPMRVSFDGTPAAGAPYDILSPPLLHGSLGTVRAEYVLHDGYLFQMWLPDAAAVGIREDYSGGKLAAPFPDPTLGAHLWCCYAWPVSYDHTGKRAFFINQRGVVLEYSNRSTHPFSGRSYLLEPYFDEAYTTPNDMRSPLRIGVPNANGTVWWPVP